MRWQRGINAFGVEEWELMTTRTLDRAGVDLEFLARWTIYIVRARRTHVNPSGEIWRAQRDGIVVRCSRMQRVRSWRSRHAAMGAIEELARLGL